MHDEEIDHLRVRSADDLRMPSSRAPGRHRHRPTAEAFSAPLVPPDAGWDPVEELAWMLQDSMADQFPRIPAARDETAVTIPTADTSLWNLQEITAEIPPFQKISQSHRKVRERNRPGTLQTASFLIATLTAIIASAVSFFSGMAAYDPLRVMAMSRMQGGIVAWWPLLVYGPWLVASLSVLRAALHQRRTVHSWCMILLFSSIAILLCVDQAPKTFLDTTSAALPGLSALACFQQAVRQITLTRAPRRTMRRHRSTRSPLHDPCDEEPTDTDVPAP
ncbi:DUF2637 domain-containing protein [Streptomyces sp. NBC_00576]|uniref:DUF2637 domain-containing protein n=1 Tax=Streptomyces sp. NBC_00576 TaxID=2903665 RepID=UPI002E809EC0|nr:DUF2637 domain-containing protein [Streptomyces sp. NBC_00576]WUB73237.1 DUF2637 domain-containing protein [Streptomyces sp. NBC_00576]